MLNRRVIWIESTKTKVPLPLVENQFDYAAFIIQFWKAPTMYNRSTLCWENRYVNGTKTTFSALFHALMMRVLRHCICWRFHNVRATRGRVAKFQFLKKLSWWPIFFLLQISSELKILEHNVKTDSVFCLDFKQFRLKGKKKMSRSTLFDDRMFLGRICTIKLTEISRTYLNKHFGVKIISIGQIVC